MESAARDFLAVACRLTAHREGVSRDGIDRDAINALLERNCVELEIWRVKSLAELRGWLNPDCMSLN
jgi:hypothetical protein